MELQFGKVDEAIAVMKEVSLWGRNRGYRVWLDEWLTRDELITSEAQPEDFCIGVEGDKITCAFILQRMDSEYWGNASAGEALYVHKLCVSRDFAGRNMSSSVIEEIARYARKKNIKYIRLDTALDEKVVRKIYLNIGFKIVDIIDYPNGASMALYEYEV